MRFRSIALAVSVFVAIVPRSYTSDVASQDIGERLTHRYHEAKSEVEKRDLALKLIDVGVLRKFKTTQSDVARIFGADWTPDFDVGEYESYGIVHFARQPKGPDNVQVPYVGWCLVIHYNTKDKVVVSWSLSDDHK